MLLLLMCGDVAMNPGQVMLGSVDVRSIRNKGLSSLIQLYLTPLISSVSQKHIRTTDSDSFLRSLTPDGFSLIHRSCTTGIGGGAGFFIHESYKCLKVDTPNSYQFQCQVDICSYLLSIVLLGRVLPFLDEFMSFVFCLLLMAITSSVVISIYMLICIVLIVANRNP